MISRRHGTSIFITKCIGREGKGGEEGHDGRANVDDDVDARGKDRERDT